MRWKTVGAVAAALVLVPTGVAVAAPADEFTDTGGEYVPLPADFYDDEGYTVDGCGSTLTITDGDVRELEENVDVRDDGSVEVLYRGGYTVDVVRESDGARLDELPNDGEGFEYYSPDGLFLAFGFRGPTLSPAFDEVEAQVYADAGLPEVFYYTDGYFEESIRLSPDPDAETIESAEVVQNLATGVRDVCDLLDEADDDGQVDGIN